MKKEEMIKSIIKLIDEIEINELKYLLIRYNEDDILILNIYFKIDDYKEEYLNQFNMKSLEKILYHLINIEKREFHIKKILRDEIIELSYYLDFKSNEIENNINILFDKDILSLHLIYNEEMILSRYHKEYIINRLIHKIK